MRFWWYGDRIGGFSNETGIPPKDELYKFIGRFRKEQPINKNMYLLKCTETEVLQKEFKNPFETNKRTFTKNDILRLYESMDDTDEIIITK